MAEDNPILNFNLVILDDSYVIRNVLKNEIYKRIRKSYPSIQFDIFASGDGVGGLGYIYITKPKVIILDTTLPRYSGREIFEFVQSNANYVLEHTLVILISQSPFKNESLPSNYKVLDKSDTKFLDTIVNGTAHHIESYQTSSGIRGIELMKPYRTSIISKMTVFLANVSDKLNNPRSFNTPLTFIFKPFSWILWVVSQLVLMPFFISYSLLLGNVLGESQIRTSGSSVQFRSVERQGFSAFIFNVGLTFVKLLLFLMVNVIILLISRGI